MVRDGAKRLLTMRVGSRHVIEEYPAIHQSALDPAARDGVYLGYEHHSSPIPSLVAHLLEVAGAISFL
jgi:hypothetical protein